MPPTNSDDLLADRYRLDGILGSGGMSEVHRAWDTRLRRFVAIKLFRLGTDAVARRRFDNEIRTLAGLSHPGLVSVYDAGASDRTAFVVLQLVNGRTLHERIGRGPMSPAETRLLGARLADALAYVHSLGVVHRDVKPSNILLDSGGTAYLADFGLARLSTATHLTKTGQMVGTAAYLAPEQVRGDEVTGPADIYALGLVLLECLTGQQEYQGTEVEVAVARLHRPPLIPRDLPDDLVRLLSLMTSLTPRRRPSAEECALILRGEAGSATIPVGPVVLDHDEAEDDWIEQHEADAAPTLVPAPRRASKVALIAAAATVLGISGVALAPKGAAPTTSTPAEQPASATSSESPPAPATSSQVAPPVQEVVTYTSTVVVPVEQVVEQPRPQVREPWHDDNEKSAGKGKKRGDS